MTFTTNTSTIMWWTVTNKKRGTLHRKKKNFYSVELKIKNKINHSSQSIIVNYISLNSIGNQQESCYDTVISALSWTDHSKPHKVWSLYPEKPNVSNEIITLAFSYLLRAGNMFQTSRHRRSQTETCNKSL